MTSRLQIHAGTRRGKSFLANCYYTQPFKVANVTEDKNDVWLRLMLMSSSPGVLDTDDYKMEIVLDEDCFVQLTTQSYQRLFSMNKGARQHLDVTLKSGSSFIFIPHPSVPHENSMFTSRNRIYLADSSLLIWGEVLTCGRKLNGEIFRFSKYQSITEIFLHGKMIVKENLMMAPGSVPVNVMGQLEGYTHQASLICIDFSYWSVKLIDEIHELLSVENDIDFGVSALPVPGFTVRLLGNKSEQLYNCLQAISVHVVAFRQKDKSIQSASYAS